MFYESTETQCYNFGLCVPARPPRRELLDGLKLHTITNSRELSNIHWIF